MATLEASIPTSAGTQREDFLLPKDIYLSPQIAQLPFLKPQQIPAFKQNRTAALCPLSIEEPQHRHR